MTTKPPTSLRVPEELQVRVLKWAQEKGIPRNAAYVELIARGLKAAGPLPGLNERPLVGGLPKAAAPKLPDTSRAKVRGPGTNTRIAPPKLASTWRPHPKPGKK